MKEKKAKAKVEGEVEVERGLINVEAVVQTVAILGQGMKISKDLAELAKDAYDNLGVIRRAATGAGKKIPKNEKVEGEGMTVKAAVSHKMIETVFQEISIYSAHIDAARVKANESKKNYDVFKQLCMVRDEMLRILYLIGFPGVVVAESLSDGEYSFSKDYALALINQEGGANATRKAKKGGAK